MLPCRFAHPSINLANQFCIHSCNHTTFIRLPIQLSIQLCIDLFAVRLSTYLNTYLSIQLYLCPFKKSSFHPFIYPASQPASHNAQWTWFLSNKAPAGTQLNTGLAELQRCVHPPHCSIRAELNPNSWSLNLPTIVLLGPAPAGL